MDKISAWGYEATLQEWASIIEIPVKTLQSRLRMFHPEESIITPKGRRPDRRLMGTSFYEDRKNDIIEKYKGYMHQKEMLLIVNAHRDEKKKREEELKKLREENQQRVEMLKESIRNHTSEVHMNSMYRVVYFNMVSSASGYWKTEVMKGSKLFRLIIGNHSVESWEAYYG